MKPKRGERVEAVCAWCGKPFAYVFYSRTRTVCYRCAGDKRRKAKMEEARRKEKKRREAKWAKARGKQRLSLDEKIREATRLHLTYGEYMVLRERRQC